MDEPVMESYLADFKKRMKIFHSSEDEQLIDLLEISYRDISSLIGLFDPKDFLAGKELVFERSRYVYNDSLEFFYDNFQQRIMDLSLELSGGDDDGDSS